MGNRCSAKRKAKSSTSEVMAHSLHAHIVCNLILQGSQVSCAVPDQTIMVA